MVGRRGSTSPGRQAGVSRRAGLGSVFCEVVFRGHRRQVRVLFGLMDMLLMGLAFQFAYSTRSHLELKYVFFLTAPTVALLLGWSMLVWVTLGFWWEIYDRIE